MKQETLETVKKVHGIFKNRGLTLSAAESCTGGLISHYLTAPAGASAFFSAGVICYSVDAKKTILGIPEETVSGYGVVSEETAREMAERVRMITGTDYSVSTTGNLGPDVLEGKERGLVYIAAVGEGKTIAQELRLHGDRDANREEAALSALRLLIELVEGEFSGCGF
ncbi:MAG: CinA family protein [Deferribacteres bacterium]|nr:CinA family protein [Deferribacteres bacterium]